MKRFCLTINFNDQAKALDIFQKLQQEVSKDVGNNGLFLGKVELTLTSVADKSIREEAFLNIKFFADDFEDINLAAVDVKGFLRDKGVLIGFEKFNESWRDEGPGRYDAFANCL